MKKILFTILTGVVLFIASFTASLTIKNKINSTEYSLSVFNSAGGSVVVAIDDETANIESGHNSTFKVKRKTKVTLTATADDKHVFANWEKDNHFLSSDQTITLSVSANTEIKNKYNAKTITLSIDGQNVSFPLTSNLLDFLNEKYPTADGYINEFKIGEEVVTNSTQLSSDTTITRKVNLITYTATFKHNGEVITTKDYNVENASTITAPNLPTVPAGYEVKWQDFDLTTGNVVINTITTPITYIVTFKVGDEEVTSIDNKYTVEDKTIVYPDLTSHNTAGYSYTWPTTILTIGNVEIIANKSANEFTINYNLNGGDLATTNPDTYTIETPFTLNNPTKAGFTFLGWTYAGVTDPVKTVSIEKGSTGDLTFTANWEQNHSTIKLGTLENVAKIYYRANSDNSFKELTKDGFEAVSGTKYFFKADVAKDSDTQYFVLENITIKEKDASMTYYDDATGFSFTENGNEFEIGAIAVAFNFTKLTFAERIGLSGGDELFTTIPWLSEANRAEAGEVLKYTYDDVDGEISIDEYLRYIYSVQDTNGTKVITKIDVDYPDGDFAGSKISNVETLINLFKDWTLEDATITFTYGTI